GATSMIEIGRLGFVVVTVLALAGFAGRVAAAEAGSTYSEERFEVSAVKAVRPFLIDTLAALQQGDLQRAKEAFEAYDSGWNGIEVYINTRSRALYQALELELQAKIAKALDAPSSDMASLISDVRAMIAKYDE